MGSIPSYFLLLTSYFLVILHPLLKVGLRVLAGGAVLQGLFAFINITALAAVPFGFFRALKHGAVLHTGQQLQIALLVVLLGSGNQLKGGGTAPEALLLRNAG